jgi:hypothetical protein
MLLNITFQTPLSFVAKGLLGLAPNSKAQRKTPYSQRQGQFKQSLLFTFENKI